MPGSLIGLTYSEFDNKVGPQLKFSYPADVMSNELFEAFSDYVIVASQLCDKSIVVTLDDMIFLNYSVAIDNPKYDRNALLFSFGCILAEGADTEPYETILRKVSSTFVNLEIETEYLFQPDSKPRVQDFLKTLYNDLNNHNESCIKLDNANYFAVKLFKAPSQHIAIRDYDVPVFKLPCLQNSSLNPTITTSQPHQQFSQVDLSILPWDISFQHLLPFIDGKSSVKRIIKQVDMDGDYVKRSLALLVFHECIILTDIFKFTNVYQLIRSEYSLQQLANTQVLNELREYCALDTRFCATDNDYRANNKTSVPSNNQLINFVFKMQNNKTVQQIILDSLEPVVNTGPSLANSRSAPSLSAVANMKFNNIIDSPRDETENPRTLPFQNMDLARCIAYLQHLGIIKRVHEYPSYASLDPPTRERSDSGGNEIKTGPNRRRLSFSGISSDSTQPTRRLQIPDSLIPSESETSEASGGASAKSDGIIFVEDQKDQPTRFKSKSQSMLDFHTVTGGTLLQRRVSDVGQSEANNSNHGSITDSIGLGISPADPPHIQLPSSAVNTPASAAGDNNNNATLTPSGSNSNFQKSLARTKVVVGRNYLTNQGGASNATSAKVSIESIAMSLTGKYHLDHICTEFNVSYNDIVQCPGISLTYK